MNEDDTSATEEGIIPVTTIKRSHMDVRPLKKHINMPAETYRSTNDIAPEDGPKPLSALMISTKKPEPLTQRSFASKGVETKATHETTRINTNLKSGSEDPNATLSMSNELRSNWTVQNNDLRTLPSYYPLEKTSRYIHDATPRIIGNRISEFCRIMSVHAQYDNEMATASLYTSDHIDIHVSLWRGSGHTVQNDQFIASDDSSQPCTIVEIQRRKGCPIRYHRYCRQLLDAAIGQMPDDGSLDSDKLLFSKQVLKITESEDLSSVQTNTLLALDIAASLLKKDRMDARELGMESLCLLTDPSKTGFGTALMASRAVLLGVYQTNDGLSLLNADCGIREAVLSLIQFGRLTDDMDGDMNDLVYLDSQGPLHPEEREHYFLLHNLALTVLSNALNVLEQSEVDDSLQSLDVKVGARPTSQDADSVDRGQASSTPSNISKFLKESSEISHRELISTLLGVLGQAAAKPHNACLSAQCLRHLFQASITARRRARELNAKQIVSTALDVGRRTHAKLELEAEKVKHELMRLDDDDEDSDMDE